MWRCGLDNIILEWSKFFYSLILYRIITTLICTINSQCKACGLTQETRTAHCASKGGKIYNESFCANRQLPELSRPCKSPACEFQWFTSQWSNCSAECGKGVQSRRVLCAQFDGTAIKPSDDESKCAGTEKPEESKECEVKKECPGQWFTGPWSKCSKECGGGDKSRKVLCIANGESIPVTKCDQETIEFTSEECNKEPCIDDEIIPVNTSSKPIEEDDEGEEWCDEDDDESETTDSLEVIKVTTDDSSIVSGSTDASDSTDTSDLTDDDLMFSDTTLETDSSDGTTDVSRKIYLNKQATNLQN